MNIIGKSIFPRLYNLGKSGFRDAECADCLVNNLLQREFLFNGLYYLWYGGKRFKWHSGEGEEQFFGTKLPLLQDKLHIWGSSPLVWQHNAVVWHKSLISIYIAYLYAPCLKMGLHNGILLLVYNKTGCSGYLGKRLLCNVILCRAKAAGCYYYVVLSQ